MPKPKDSNSNGLAPANERVYRMLAELYGFTPLQVDEMTHAQLESLLSETLQSRFYRLREAWRDLALTIAYTLKLDSICNWLSAAIQYVQRKLTIRKSK